jgi:hypothetical protein
VKKSHPFVPSSMNELAMNWLLGVATGVLLAICLVIPSSAVAQAVVNPQVETAYVQPSNQAYQAIHDWLKKRGVLEELRQFLAPLRLPRKLTVKLDQCGTEHPPYKPQGSATICYELVHQIEKVAAKANANERSSVIAGAFIQAALYEVAHAVLDLLEVPVWGRLGDAADRFSALVMLKFGDELAVRTMSATAVFFSVSQRTWTGSAFAATDSPEAQRFYNYLCIAYGGSPRFGGLEQVIPQSRRARCEGEYRQVLKAFDMRIMPSVDADSLVKVRAMPWLLASDLK